MISGRSVRFASFFACQQLGKSWNQASKCAKEKVTSYRFLITGFDKTILLHSSQVSGSAGGNSWLKKETRKEYCLTAEEFKCAIESDEIYVIDVREPYEVAIGRVPAKRFVNIPLGNIFTAFRMTNEEFKKHFGVSKFQKQDKIVTMCKVGIRSTFALQAAQEYGYKNTKHYLGGWAEWQSTYPQLRLRAKNPN